MSQESQAKEGHETQDSFWDQIVEGADQYGSSRKRQVLRQLIHHFANDEFHGMGDFPSQIGHGKSRRMPRRCREVMK